MEEERELVIQLIMNVDLFAWAHSEISGIDTKMVSHHTTIHPSTRLVA